MKHNFDFNKLFSMGINYQRLSNADLVREKIAQRAQDPSGIHSVKSSEGARYNVYRAYQSIGLSSQAKLKEIIRAVANFA